MLQLFVTKFVGAGTNVKNNECRNLIDEVADHTVRSNVFITDSLYLFRLTPRFTLVDGSVHMMLSF